MFFVLSKLLDVALSPLTWVIALCFWGAFAQARKKPTRALRAAPIAATALLYFFSIEPVSNALWRKLEAPAFPTVRADVTYDAVILLGGVVERANGTSGQPSYNDNVERLLTTYDLLRNGRAQIAILSGGPIDPEGKDAIEARVLGAQLEAWGIAKERLIIEDKARNTRENAVESARIVREHGWTKLLIVTSAFHMARSIECFNAVGLEVDALPVDYRSFDPKGHTSFLPRAGSLAQSTSAIREFVGRLVYRLRGFGNATLQTPP